MSVQETLVDRLVSSSVADDAAAPDERPHLEVVAADDGGRGVAAAPRLKATPRWAVSSGYVGLIWLAAYSLAGSPASSIPHAMVVATVLTVVWVLALRSVEGISRVRAFAVGQSVSLLVGSVLATLSTSAVGLWFPSLGLRPLPLAGVAGAALVLTSAWHALVMRSTVKVRRVLVIGSGAATVDLLETLAAEPEEKAHFDIFGVVTDRESDSKVAGVPVLGAVDDLHDLVLEERPDIVVLAVQRNRPEVFRQLLEVAGSGFQVVGLPEFYEHAFGRVPVRHVTPAWFMSVLHLYQRPYTQLSKRIFDVVVAALGLVLTAPLFPLITLLVRRTPGGVIYRQTRLGENGRHFTIYKFRTMRSDAEDPGSAMWALENDSRVTPSGRFLRKTRLDELPQLWNVLKGDMSIVGPRPERPEFLELLEDAVPYWTRRHLLKPGITGWAQVRNGYAADCLGTETKLCYDLWYLRHRSLVIDIIICARTVPRLLSGLGAR